MGFTNFILGLVKTLNSLNIINYLINRLNIDYNLALFSILLQKDMIKKLSQFFCTKTEHQIQSESPFNRWKTEQNFSNFKDENQLYFQSKNENNSTKFRGIQNNCAENKINLLSQFNQLNFREASQINKKNLFKLRKQKIIESLIKNMHCEGDNQAQIICFSKCQNYSLLCNKQDCKCIKNHKCCSFINLRNFNKNILQNLLDSNSIVTKIKELFSCIMKRLQDTRDQVVYELANNFGLTQHQVNYINMFAKLENQKEPFEKQSLKKEKKEKKYIQQNKMIDIIISQGHMSIQQRLANFQRKFKFILNSENSQINEKFSNIKSIFSQFCSKKFDYMLDSIIVKQVEQKVFLFNSLQEKVNVKEFNLLYRASQNNFSTQMFEQKCNGKSNLLILIQNENHKKYGGFTPCKYDIREKGIHQRDNSLKSFLFTLSDKLKFNLLKKQFAFKNIQNNQGLLSFGQTKPCSMFISNNANVQKKNWFYPDGAYQSNNFNLQDGRNYTETYLLDFEVYEVIYSASD